MTLVIVAVLAAMGVGFGAGWGLKPDGAAEAIAEQTDAIRAVQEGQFDILEEAQKPVQLDAALRAVLVEMPPQCVRELGGDPMSAQCAWAYCVRTGQSSAQRCQDVQFTQAVLDAIKKNDSAACPPVP